MATVVIIAERVLPDRGGLAVATSRIAAQAAARGDDVHVVHLSKQAAPGGRGLRQRDGVTFHPVGVLADAADGLMALTEHAADVAGNTSAELIHGIYATRAGYAAVLVAGRLGIPSVVSLRGNDLDRGLFRARDLPFLTLAMNRATLATGVSRALCDTAAAAFQREVVHITNSVDADRFHPETRDNTIAASLGLGTDPVIGFSGELREKKGIRFLLPSFAAIAERRSAHMLLIGGVRGDAKQAFEAFRERAPQAAERIHVVDYDRSPKRLCRLLAMCDFLVFPSLYEGTPNAVLEAMAAARPVLVTRVGGHIDLIDHGKTGALLGLDELDRLPEAIDEMIALTRAEREAMGQAARAHVIAHHAPAAESEAWAALYARALATSSR